MPRWLETGAAYAWRLIGLAGALFVADQIFGRVYLVVLPVVGALFLTAILAPPVRWLRRHGLPPLLATWLAFLVFVGAFVAAGFLIAPSLQGEFRALGNEVSAGTTKVQDWLVNGPLHMSRQQVQTYVDNARHSLSANRGRLLSLAVTGVSVAVDVVAGLLLTLVLTFFFVKDGDAISRWLLGLFSTEHQEDAREVGHRSWRALTGYVRGTAVNGVVNSAVMAIGLAVLGVPVIGPIALLTFVGAFLPIVGAFASGGVAALVALVAKGPLTALLVVGLTVVIHHLEGYLVGPLVLGRAVRLHPVAVLLALTTGGLLAGVVGAFLAVPITAVIASIASYYRSKSTPGDVSGNGHVDGQLDGQARLPMSIPA